MVQVQPFDFGNTLKTQRLQQRSADQRDRQLAQNDRRLAIQEEQLAQAASARNQSTQEFMIDLMRDVAGQVENVDQVVGYMRSVGLASDPEDEAAIRAAFQDAPPGMFNVNRTTADRDFSRLTEGLTPEQVQQAREVELGIAPRAVTAAPKIQDIGGVPHIFDPSTQKMVPVEVQGQEVTTGSVAASQAEIAATEDAAKAGIKMSGEAIAQLNKVKTSIRNINDAIQAIDEGAETGPIISRLPSVTQASIELDNVRSRMGLDIIGSVTFGALSEGELNLALSTALPTNLEPPALKQWLIDKRNAQQKLARELEGAAIFLGQPGNTPAKYLELMRDAGAYRKQGESETVTINDDGTTVEFL